MVRRSQNQREPDLSPERALRALSQQLEKLQSLKNRNFHEAESEKTEWEYLTYDIIEDTFGK